MNLLFISPHFPPNFAPFCVRLRDRGVNVLAIADADWAALVPDLQAAIADYRRLPNVEDYETVYRTVADLIATHGRIDRVESHNEHWLELEGRLREDFNIPGPRTAETERVKRKSLMKEAFRRAGVPVARGEPLGSLEQVESFAATVGYPLIAKPDIGVGAWGTVKLCDARDLHEFLGRRPPIDYLVEEFIDGSLVTFDGLTDASGRIVFHTSHLSATGVLEVVSDNTDLSYYSVRTLSNELEDLGRRSVGAFGVREKFFHVEFLRRHRDGSLVVMEMNMRPPGGFTTDLMNFACDIDVYDAWADIVTGGPGVEQYERRFHAAHVARKYGKQYRFTHEEIVARHGDKICMVSEVAPIFSAVMGNFAYIVRSPDLGEVEQMIADIQAKAGGD